MADFTLDLRDTSLPLPSRLLVGFRLTSMGTVRSRSKTSENAAPKIPRSAWEYLLAGGFLLFLFCYVLVRVEPALRYYDSAPVLRLDGGVLSTFLTRPGGTGDLLSALLAQCDIYNWLGAVVITGLAAVMFLVTRLFLKRCQTQSFSGPFIPLFLLIVLSQSYEGSVYPAALGFLFASILAVGYACIPSRWLRFVAGWVGLGLAWFLFGCWPTLMLALLCAACESFTPRFRQGLLFLVPAVAVSYWGAHAKVVLQTFPSGWPLAAGVALYLCLPAMILVGKTWLKPQPAPIQKGKGHSRLSWREKLQRWSPRLVVSAGVVFVALAWFTFNQNQKQIIDIRYHAARKEWAEAVRAGTNLKAIDTASEIELLRALFHTGGLGENLFAYPLPNKAEILPGLSPGPKAWVSQAETLFDLGQINLSEHLAHEALELSGDKPQILMLLARINVLKDRPRAARVFLNVLGKLPFHHAEAEVALRRLDADPKWADDSELNEIRARMVKTDQPAPFLNDSEILTQLLQGNPVNRMAFEYLMVHWLLTRQLEPVVKNMRVLTSLGYSSIPRHFEEAVLVYQTQFTNTEVTLPAQGIRSETRERFQQYLTMRRQAENSAAEQRDFVQTFFRSFWFYYQIAGGQEHSSPQTIAP